MAAYGRARAGRRRRHQCPPAGRGRQGDGTRVSRAGSGVAGRSPARNCVSRRVRLRLCSRSLLISRQPMVVPRSPPHPFLMLPDPIPPPVDDATSLLAELRVSRFAFGLRCPRCTARHVHRWGTFNGRQRYRCVECRRTFSDLTGTPAHYAKKLSLWPAYALCLRRGLSIRRSAARIGVHPTSAFRWRHRILDALRERDHETTRGWVEVETVWFAHSCKGARHLCRDGRRRGRRPGHRRQGDRVPVILACDRVGAAVSAALRHCESGLLLGRRVDESLGPKLSPGSVLTARDGRFGPIAVVARRRGLAFHEALRPGPRRKVRQAHAETVLDYRDRFLDWIGRFRGVATRYLPNYLIWHRAVDVAYRRGIARAVLRWPIHKGPY